MVRRAVLFLIACAVFGVARTAHAQASLDLTWNAPPTCPDRAWVVANVQRLVTTMPSEPLRVVAAAREQDGQWNVELEMHGAASGTRSLRAATCTSAARAAALIVALALDPQAATLASDELARGDVAPPTPASDPEEHARSAPAVAPHAHERTGEAPVEPRTSERGPRVVATLGASVERGLLPGWAPGATIGVGLLWRSLRVDVRGQVAPDAAVSLARAPAIGADFTAAAIALRGCAGQVASSLAIHACGALRGARVAGEGRGATETYREVAWLTSFEPGALLRVPSGRALAVELDLAMVLPLTRPEFVIATGDAHESLFVIPAIGMHASVSGSYRF